MTIDEALSINGTYVRLLLDHGDSDGAWVHSGLLHNCARCIESLNVSGCWLIFTGNRNDKGPHKRASEGLADVDASLTCGSGDIAALRPF